MEIRQEEINARGIKFIAWDNNQEVGRAYLYLLTNDLHNVPFGFIEDVFVSEEYRGQGIGTKLVGGMIECAKKEKCHKIIMTSRYGKDKVHSLYTKIGFEDWGKEFRMNLS